MFCDRVYTWTNQDNKTLWVDYLPEDGHYVKITNEYGASLFEGDLLKYEERDILLTAINIMGINVTLSNNMKLEDLDTESLLSILTLNGDYVGYCTDCILKDKCLEREERMLLSRK